MRQNEKRRKRNKKRKSEIRTAIRRFEEALEEGDVEEARERLRIAESKWDRAASKGVVPKNRASRKISRLKRRFASFEDEQG